MTKRIGIFNVLLLSAFIILPGFAASAEDAAAYTKVPYLGLNGTFDRGISGWSNYCNKAKPPVAEKTETKAGKGAMKLVVPQGGEIHIWQSLELGSGKGIPAVGDKPVGSFYIKLGEDVTPAEGRVLLFKVEAYSAAGGKTLLSSVELNGGETKGEWLYFETPLGGEVPKGAEVITVALEDDLPGTVYVDEICVYKTVPQPTQ